MLLLYRLLVFLTPIAVFTGFGAIFLFPRYFIIWGIIIISALIISIFLLLRKQKSAKQDKIFFFISPVTFVLSSIMGGIFLNSSLLKLIFAVFISIITFLYLENLFLYFYIPTKYHIYSLENIASYLNLLAIFFIFFSFLGLKILFGLGIYLVFGLVLLNVIIVVLLICQTLWINKISLRDSKVYIFIATLVLTQIYLIIYLLPSSFYVNGLIFALSYYVIIGLLKQKLLKKLETRLIMRHLTIGLALLLLLLITAKWA